MIGYTIKNITNSKWLEYREQTAKMISPNLTPSIQSIISRLINKYHDKPLFFFRSAYKDYCFFSRSWFTEKLFCITSHENKHNRLLKIISPHKNSKELMHITYLWVLSYYFNFTQSICLLPSLVVFSLSLQAFSSVSLPSLSVFKPSPPCLSNSLLSCTAA